MPGPNPTKLDAPQVLQHSFDESSGSLRTTDIILETALGNIPNSELVRVFGHNTDIDAGNTEDVWDAGGSYEGFLDIASTVSIVSTSTNDTEVGSGARTATIQGLNSDYEEITEIVTLNGTTPVITSLNYLRVFKIVVSTAGVSQANLGNITATVGGSLVGFINAGYNTTHQSFYTVPANKTAILFHFFSMISPTPTAFGEKYGQLIFQLREFGGIFLTRSVILINSNNSPTELSVTSTFNEKSDLRWQFASDTSNTFVGVSYRMYLVDNG